MEKLTSGELLKEARLLKDAGIERWARRIALRYFIEREKYYYMEKG